MGAPPTPLTPGQPAPLAPGEFVSSSVPNVVTFGFDKIGPPSNLYVQRDDTLLVRAFNIVAGAALRVEWRMLLALGQGAKQPLPSGMTAEKFQPIAGSVLVRGSQTLPLDTTRNENDLQIQLAEGYLLSLVVSDALVAPLPGQTFVEALLFAGPVATGFNGQLLCAGYPSGVIHIGWPGGQVAGAFTGPGWLHSQQQANPAAGADWILTVPIKTRWGIYSFQAQLLTSGAVASRNVQVIVDDGVNIYWTHDVGASILASTTAQVTGTRTQAPTGVVTTVQNAVLPPSLILPPGHRVRTSTVNLQVLDQWSNIFFLVEEWLGA